MGYALSLLDKSPIHDGETASTALKRTVALARQAEQWGFHRFWVAEHHDAPTLASSSPEVLIAFLLANTSRIRVGSGGVMLQHYSPYKVAENFNVLAALGPGRVDLGVGKAPGGLPFSTRALQGVVPRTQKQDFSAQLAQLSAFLDQGLPADDPLAGVQATPRPAIAANRFLLGASVDSALLAASQGWDFVFASHLNGDETILQETLDAYQKAAHGRAPLLAVGIVAAETDAEADRLTGNIQHFKVHVDNGQSVTVGSVEQAEEYARQSGAASYRIEKKTPNVLRGAARTVSDQLDRLHDRYGIGEFIIDTPINDAAKRLRSIELLAQAQFAAAA
ncbi:LLM class flavin-dependent oxidoreductase [Phyllobacterium myrsinacearum]|uniref:Alkane 1-monooxygenase n=1 Tax=Phyllobacterium myrsinacearum TaxID=28101 RepID=A0A2S9J9W6_9HYPH|nr:LLM class flavin-dependent oxidoreductase [Phyllobacterium myrsinacearum]PRD49573.1 alkane 1-monooxygenase [Phyllobacterium myrsinacearum]PWV83546.1 luciferase family oxidoreductase group 1 [Phyllobacterium myrsinacearum]RZU96852.1 luciferase family oxidoreductase group 1 [Phyllobacterium myrsinacearum]